MVTRKKNMYIQGVLLPDPQMLKSDSRHEDKHYKMGNHGAQTSSVGAREHYSLTHSHALARQHGATFHAGDALGRQSSMISTSGVPS